MNYRATKFEFAQERVRRSLVVQLGMCIGHSNVSTIQRVTDYANLQGRYKYFGKEVNSVLERTMTSKFIKDDEFIYLFELK